jgi:hypothetical protein
MLLPLALVEKGLQIDILLVEHIKKNAPLVFISGAFANMLH